MFSNKLKLNADKSEFLILRSKYRVNSISSKSLFVDGDIINEFKSVKNLDVHIDNKLSFERHVISICKAQTQPKYHYSDTVLSTSTLRSN